MTPKNNVSDAIERLQDAMSDMNGGEQAYPFICDAYELLLTAATMLGK